MAEEKNVPKLSKIVAPVFTQHNSNGLVISQPWSNSLFEFTFY